jgi:GNAT superfamily N-acetyltransferase
MLNIRRAGIVDIGALTRLRLDLFRELDEISGQEDTSLLDEATRRYFAEMLLKEEFVAWIAEAEDEIIGTSALVFFRRPPYQGNLAGIEAYVLNIFTVPEWRGKGIATALVNEILAFVRTTEAKRVWLHASSFGKHIYELAGFDSTTSEMELRL